jgi:hypothetical protein
LPFAAKELSKRDLESHRELFALYLDVQKQIDILSLEESEVKGRWKSFVRKWNEVSFDCRDHFPCVSVIGPNEALMQASVGIPPNETCDIAQR